MQNENILPAADIVIVGGGPIGLAHAIGFKKINPALNVVVLEKYTEYQRKHTLIMQPAELKRLMTAMGDDESGLHVLYDRLRHDKHIRTNELEETFRKIAENLDVQWVQDSVTSDRFNTHVFDRWRPALVVGADGTHSTVSGTVFGEDNQIKHDFDYVLQLRYEILGEQKPCSIRTLQFYQHMARHGLIANEYVGAFANGKTPVTMQMMIARDTFADLQFATSKNPLRPFVAEQEEYKQDVNLPRPVQSFVTGYLAERVKELNAAGYLIDRDSVRISVNEAPATQASRTAQWDAAHQAHCLLVGDAALGLSYFKGLNAGLHACATLLIHMRTALDVGLKDRDTTTDALMVYDDWFQKDFAPRKIQEVRNYSRYQINLVWNGMSLVQSLKETSVWEPHEDMAPFIWGYFDHLGDARGERLQRFPHREYDPVYLGQFDHIPAKHHLSRTGKLFVDYVKPYKHTEQLKQDFKQPLVGSMNVLSGTFKFTTGIFGRNGKYVADGLLSVGRGSG